ncbi:MAG: hypothetical protein EHJ95_00310 [Methanobacteriota archaeon]|nr:MAG: hypothetical protein EHJ95_00310 [Euryarchaeota archaeon]
MQRLLFHVPDAIILHGALHREGDVVMRVSYTFRRLPALLITIASGLIGILLLVMVAAYLMQWPIIPIITDLQERLQQMALIVAGAFIAALFGIYTNVTTAEAQREEEVRKVAMGFYYEVKNLKEKVSRRGLSSGNSVLVMLAAMDPLYSSDGLYFLLRKEVFSLDKDIIELILHLYPNVICIWKVQEALGQGAPATYQSSEVGDLLREIVEDIDRLLPLLERDMREQ